MSSGGGGGPGKKARIEIIPLIDIMFFLLASFMLVSMSMLKLQAVQNDLPEAHKGDNVTKPDFHTVGIDKTGKYYFDKEKDPVPLDQINGRLQKFYNEQGPDTLKVFINADKDITYNMLIIVLDQLRAMGVKKVSFAVKRGKPGGSAAPAAPAAPAVPASTP